jgi:rod shape-determining protein MreC
MRNLIGFILKHYFLILFLIFEGICFMLIYQTSYYQRHSVISSSNRITGTLHEMYSMVAGYLVLNEENEALAHENATLRSLIPTDTISYGTPGFAKADTAFRYISAKVISNSINKRNNYFVINKGTDHGVSIDMGVVSTNGIAGIIIAVSDHFATGMSMLHKESRISGKIKKNGQLINIIWEGPDYRTGRVIDIPTHLELYPGDTIITSGNSLIFPEGIMVGTITEYYQNRDQLFNTADLGFTTDFNSLYFVYLVENRNQEELEELQNNIMDE